MTTRPTTNYLRGWFLVALVAVAVTVVASAELRFDLRLALVVGGLITVAELIIIRVNLGPTGAAFTLSEAGIVAGFLLVDPAYVVLGTAIATLVAHLPMHLSGDKVLFNVSQVIVCTAGAGLAMSVVPDVGPIIGQRSLLAGVGAMATYATLNTLAFRGLILRVAGDDARDVFDEQAPLTLASMFGTVAVGIVAAHLWVTQPVLIVLLLAPLLAIQIAARSSLRAEALVTTLREERDQLEQVVLGASDGILLLDEDATIRLWSPAIERLTGIPAETALGQPVERLLTDDRRQADDVVRGRWLVEHDSERRSRVDARWVASDGQVRDVQEDHALLHDGRGRCNGDVVLVRDVSRERMLERSRGDFVARVSHELRTPLTPIRGYVHLLLRRGDRLTDDQRSDALHRVLERTDRLAELIEDLLLVTQLERGDMDSIVALRPWEIAPIATSVVGTIGERFEDREIAMDLDPATPPAMVDATRVRQVVSALLDNALRYSPPETSVTISLDRQDDTIRLRIVDHGPGIPIGEEERIFERFQRLEDPLHMQTTGVGVGLFIARRLARAMGGEIDLRPNPDGGSVFTVTLPMAAQDPADIQIEGRSHGDDPVLSHLDHGDPAAP
ncbi:MAG: PAS domain-containing protein [Intrasporangiaceae bacterium]|nr:PAS domain-containing protein [Intrasporangiaceae bacterium]